MRTLQELCAVALSHIGMMCLELASVLERQSAVVDEGNGEDVAFPADDHDAAPPQFPITQEAAEMIAPAPTTRKPEKSIKPPLRGSLRDRQGACDVFP